MQYQQALFSRHRTSCNPPFSWYNLIEKSANDTSDRRDPMKLMVIDGNSIINRAF